MSPLIFILTQAAILAYALVGGVFLAFSDFIMRSLANTSGTGGVEAMQVINKEVFRWVFMTLFIGMAPVSIAVAIYGYVYVGGGPGTLMALAGLVYLVGTFGVTVFCNVPMNEALAGMERDAEATLAYWTGTYLPRWVQWNTVRTIASILASALLMVGFVWLVQMGQKTT